MAAKSFVVPFVGAFDPLAVPIAGAQAHFTQAGTTTPVTIYSDDDLTTPAANPVVADSIGRFPRRYFNDATATRLRIFDADADITSDTPLADFDNYTGVDTGAQGPQGENAAVLQIGTVSAVAAGGTPTASVTDIGGGVFALNLGLVTGDTGLSGALANGDYGDIVVSASGATLTIDSGAVSLGKMANLAANSIIGNNTGSPATPLALSASQVRTLLNLDYSANVHQIPIMAAAMSARTTNGAAPGSAETTTNKIMVRSLDFDKDTIEYAQFAIAMPKGWNEGTVTAQFIYTSTGTGDVVFGLQGVAVSDDDVLDAAFGTAQTVTDSVTAANDVMITSATSAITIGGTPAEGDLVYFQVYRNATSGSDTLNADAKLIAVRLSYTTNAKDDS